MKNHEYLNWYEDMLLWRKFEEKCAAMYIQQKIRGFLHLYSGQEAVLAGCAHAIDIKKDKMITAYRCHVHPIAMGLDPKYIMAELFGKVTGSSNGKGGSMHIFSKEHNFFGGHGIVGGQILLERAWLLQTNIIITMLLHCVLWEMEQLGKVLYMKHLIWQ